MTASHHAAGIPASVCPLTGKPVPRARQIRFGEIRSGLADLILADHPQITPETIIDRQALAGYRARYVEQLLRAERGELTTLEEDVVRSLGRHDAVVARNIDRGLDTGRTPGERLADNVARFGGSWTFIVVFFTVLAAWMGLNLVWTRDAFDPYPFILLNLLLSCLAAVQAPIIMMSQSRQEAKDRQRSENDYRVNLKAELEIRHLHDKIDHLLTHQWERLAEIQAMQLEMLQDLRMQRGPAA